MTMDIHIPFYQHNPFPTYQILLVVSNYIGATIYDSADTVYPFRALKSHSA